MAWVEALVHLDLHIYIIELVGIKALLGYASVGLFAVAQFEWFVLILHRAFRARYVQQGVDGCATIYLLILLRSPLQHAIRIELGLAARLLRDTDRDV